MRRTFACNERCPSFHFFTADAAEGFGWCEDATDWSTKDICFVEYEPDDSKGECEEWSDEWE